MLAAWCALGIVTIIPLKLQAAFCDLYCYSIQFGRAETATGYLELIGKEPLLIDLGPAAGQRGFWRLSPD